MDIERSLNKIWCKPDWPFISMNEKTNRLLQQCGEQNNVELIDDIKEIIERSKRFPIPFPIETVRLQTLKDKRPIERLKENTISTYPIVHERSLMLMTHFLAYKREFGTKKEKELYKDMTVIELIDRILKKRAVMFMGRQDRYKLLSGQMGSDGWESIGTEEEKPPLVLENCLSYDEMKISAMVYVSGYTECINDGTRKNAGVVKNDNIEENAVIVGLIGPRFQRIHRLDYEDMLITNGQNVSQNGYGEEIPSSVQNNSKNLDKIKWRHIWCEHYNVPSYTYDELDSNIKEKTVESQETRYTNRYVRFFKLENIIFDNEIYYKRLSIIAESALLEAEHRAADAGRNAFLNVIGCGLGVWKISPHQLDVYILTFLERIKSFLDKALLNHVTDVNFAYINPSKGIRAMFKNGGKSGSKMKLFLKNGKHPKGGIWVYLENREPSSKLTGEHEGKLLVMTYPWDGNAHPGNEFWKKSLGSSGDPAAACSTQISELHNAHVNPAVCGANTRVIDRFGVKTLQEYLQALSQ